MIRAHNRGVETVSLMIRAHQWYAWKNFAIFLAKLHYYDDIYIRADPHISRGFSSECFKLISDWTQHHMIIRYLEPIFRDVIG